MRLFITLETNSPVCYFYCCRYIVLLLVPVIAMCVCSSPTLRKNTSQILSLPTKYQHATRDTRWTLLWRRCNTKEETNVPTYLYCVWYSSYTYIRSSIKYLPVFPSHWLMPAYHWYVTCLSLYSDSDMISLLQCSELRVLYLSTLSSRIITMCESRECILSAMLCLNWIVCSTTCIYNSVGII